VWTTQRTGVAHTRPQAAHPCPNKRHHYATCPSGLTRFACLKTFEKAELKTAPLRGKASRIKSISPLQRFDSSVIQIILSSRLQIAARDCALAGSNLMSRNGFVFMSAEAVAAFGL
jgi:hypothetical protein